MTARPHWLDRAMRGLLALPGWVLDRLEPAPSSAGGKRLSREALRARVRATARWPEAQLAMEPDLQIHDSGDAVLAYQVRGSTAFGVGGLNAEAPRDLLQSFATQAAKGARRHLVFPVRAEECDAARASGFGTIQVGVEAWLDLRELTWRGNKYEHVRHMRNKARRCGVMSAEVSPASVARELESIHAEWLASKRPAWRMKLLVGSPGLEDPGDRRYVVARTSERVEAFLTLLPGSAGQWGVDVMCRRPDAVPGAIEHAVLHAVEVLRGEGASTLSLGPCPMADVRQAGVLGAVFRLLYHSRLGNELFGFRRLHVFKQKFRPRWEPIYFAAAPRVGWFELYAGCRMWGLY